MALHHITNKLHPEYQYLHLVSSIIENGSIKTGRNGNTYSKFGGMMRYSLENNTIPFITTKKLAWKTCLKELLWFIRGQTNNLILQSQNVHIWDDNSTPEFLESRGIMNRTIGDLGPIYGFQWRHFNAPYTNCNDNYQHKGIDQLQHIIDSLSDPNDKFSRRLILSAWNPSQLHEMALPPCHVLAQFNVHDDNKLSCALYQRSADMALGIPFNIASYSFLTHLLAHHCGLQPYEFIHFIGDMHLYDDHIKPIQSQLLRTPYEFPTIQIKTKKNNINLYDVNDFSIYNYNYHPIITMKMRP